MIETSPPLGLAENQPTNLANILDRWGISGGLIGIVSQLGLEVSTTLAPTTTAVYQTDLSGTTTLRVDFYQILLHFLISQQTLK